MSSCHRLLAIALLVSSVSVGCEDAKPQARLAITWLQNKLAKNAPPPITAPLPTPTYERPTNVPTDTPQAAANSFLEAIRFGDEELARSLLTSVAQVAVRQQDTSIRFPGSPAAVHHVSRIEYPDQADTSHAWCTWCDTHTNSRRAVQMVLIEKRELPGWRIAGLVFLDENGDFGDIVDFEERPRVARSP